MVSNPDNDLRVVAMRFSGLYREFLFGLAKLLKERHNSETHLYCPRPEMADQLRQQLPDDLFDSINFISPAHPIRFEPDLDHDAVVEKAQSNERRYDRNYTWFAISDRHFGRGYAPSGFYHPRSIQSENSGYLEFLDNYNKYFEYWETEFEEKGISLLINGDRREAAVARKHGATIRIPVSARHLNFHFWATNEFRGHDQIADIFENEPLPDQPYELGRGPYVQTSLGQRLRGVSKISNLTGRILRKLYVYAKWRASGHSKGHLYLVTDELKYFFRVWREARRLQRGDMAHLSDLKDSRFVYFPLQVDPETSFQPASPEFFNQHAAIVSLSRDLPAGVLLAVKEHFPALGLRPENFYAQLSDLKNVVLLDINENSLELIKRCAATATITGSSGFEAAVIGKPVLAFGRHNLYNVMPHVYEIRDEADISAHLKAALAENFDHDAAALEGARFVAALERLSFNLEKFNHYAKDGFSDSALEEAFLKLTQEADGQAAERAGTNPGESVSAL